MNEYRITKYNPQNRNEFGHYLDIDEWTEFCEVGSKVSLQEYEIIESNYIVSAIDLISNCTFSGLTIQGLEDYRNNCPHKEGALISLEKLNAVLRSLLRGDYWCKLESQEAFIHIGYDFYMYVGVKISNDETISRIYQRGLYIEKFRSPYHSEHD
jgi:hypothetical protein